MKYNNLLYRRQFLLTHSKIENKYSWPQDEFTLGGRFCRLLRHPDLGLEHAKGNLEILLLGYLIDPFHPASDSRDIVQEMAGYHGRNEILKRTDSLNGRYVLLISDDSNIYIVNDATASRQVCYYLTENEFWIASTPNLILEFKELEPAMDPGILDYLNSSDFRNRNKPWFGTMTPYKDLFILPPNHFIDLNLKRTERFWPIEYPEKSSLKKSIETAAEIMRGTMESAARHYGLQVSLTAGWDTRMILAASRNVYRDMTFYTLDVPGNFEKNIWDYLVPSKIVETYNLKYNLIKLTGETPDRAFLDIYNKNSIFNRNIYAEVYYQYIKQGYEDKVNVTGTMGNELLRAIHRVRGECTAEKLATKLGVSAYPHILKFIRNYLESVQKYADKTGIHIIDLFDWEVFCPGWAGMSATEHDIAREELRIVNHRDLISTYMLIPEKHRFWHHPIAQRMVIKHNWPELLKFSVEPSNIRYRNLKKILRFLHIERFVERSHSLLNP